MEAHHVIRELWDRIEARAWSGAAELLAADVVIDWPASRERIVGRDNFVAVNREYPTGWSIRVLRIVAEGDQVVSEVEVPHEELGLFRVASFWTVRDGLVVRGCEYWVGVGADPVPPWREKFTELS